MNTRLNSALRVTRLDKQRLLQYNSTLYDTYQVDN
jgi:hypothetical protein